MPYRTHPQQRVQVSTQQSDAYSRCRIVSVSRCQSNQTLIWLVTNPQNDRYFSTVTQAAETLHCACQDGQTHPSSCPHLRVVQSWLKAHQQQGHVSTFPGKAERRERTLSWTDDKAFSIWKS